MDAQYISFVPIRLKTIYSTKKLVEIGGKRRYEKNAREVVGRMWEGSKPVGPKLSIFTFWWFGFFWWSMIEIGGSIGVVYN
jgi:hypothetical protein